MEDENEEYNSEIDEDELDMLYSAAYYGDAQKKSDNLVEDVPSVVASTAGEAAAPGSPHSSNTTGGYESSASSQQEPAAKRRSGGSRVCESFGLRRNMIPCRDILKSWINRWCVLTVEEWVTVHLNVLRLIKWTTGPATTVTRAGM